MGSRKTAVSGKEFSKKIESESILVRGVGQRHRRRAAKPEEIFGIEKRPRDPLPRQPSIFRPHRRRPPSAPLGACVPTPAACSACPTDELVWVCELEQNANRGFLPGPGRVAGVTQPHHKAIPHPIPPGFPGVTGASAQPSRRCRHAIFTA